MFRLHDAFANAWRMFYLFELTISRRRRLAVLFGDREFVSCMRNGWLCRIISAKRRSRGASARDMRDLAAAFRPETARSLKCEFLSSAGLMGHVGVTD